MVDDADDDGTDGGLWVVDDLAGGSACGTGFVAGQRAALTEETDWKVGPTSGSG